MGALTGDVRSVSHAKTSADDQNIQKVRDQLGTDFTTSSKRDVGKKRNELGKDDFMRLMSVQLKYQDPMSPMKNEAMAAQLAQFSSLEQMLNMNQNIEKLTNSQKPTEHMIAASMIGKKVTTANTHFVLEKNAQPDIKFNMPSDVASVKLNIVNPKGEVVREMELGEMTKGPQMVKWDGKNGKSQEQPLGEYTFNILASDKDGQNVEVKMDSSGLVTGVAFESGKSYLVVDGQKVPIESVGEIQGEGAPAAKADGAKKESSSDSGRSAKPLAADGKQNQSTPEAGKAAPVNKTAQGAKNNLPPGLTPEKIKAMLGGMGIKGEVADAGDASGAAAPQDAGPPPSMPLWNPETN